MPFIGNQPALSYTSFAKQDFTTSATTSYTLDNPVANANELALFINFVRQEPTTAYSASGTSLTLTSATSASDDMYCVFLGKAVQTVNPPNASVGTSQLIDGAVTSAKLGSDVTQGITEADLFRLTADISSNGDITSNLERCDDASYAKIGTGMTESSGVFTFPSTGLYQIKFTGYAQCAADDNVAGYIKGTTGSGYNDLAYWWISGDGSTYGTANGVTECFFNVTNTSTHKIKFNLVSIGGGSSIVGSTVGNITFMTFVRLGDSQ